MILKNESRRAESWVPILLTPRINRRGSGVALAIAAVRSGKFAFEFASDNGLDWLIRTRDGTVLKCEGDL
jgi:hypothetical protein